MAYSINMDADVTRPLSSAEAISKRKESSVKVGSTDYTLIPKDVEKELRRDGRIYNKYLSVVKANYKARAVHKAYYDKCMLENSIASDDPLPSEDFIEKYLLTFDAFLFGEFGVIKEIVEDPYSEGFNHSELMINVDGLNNLKAFLEH